MPRFYFKIYPRRTDLEVRSGGIRFIFFYFVVLLASINTGNNLLYLVLSTLTAAVLISWFMAGASLRGVHTTVELPEELYAGEESKLTFFVEKKGSIFAGQSLTFMLKSRGAPRLHLPFIDVLENNSREKIQGLVTYQHRGRYALQGVDVASTFPFGIIKRSRTFPAPEHALVYPHILPIEKILRVGAEGFHSKDSPIRGHDGGILNIRQFLPGDEPRNIHWKASARTGLLMIKEMARQKGKYLFIHFNPLTDQPVNSAAREIFELGVSVAASLVYHGREDGLDMILSAPGIRLGPHDSGDYVRRFLQYLAEVQAKRGAVSTSGPDSRRHDEFAIVVDPLNRKVEWSKGAMVLDRAYVSQFRQEGSQ